MLYGTTFNGGSSTCNGLGCGTIFQTTTTGQLTTLYNFTDGDDGWLAPGGLVQATDGNLYGGSAYGGFYDCGVLFQFTTTGKLVPKHEFFGLEGQSPWASLVQGTDGVLYGTAEFGGTDYNYGTVYGMSVGLSPSVATAPTTGRVGEKVIILGNGLTGLSGVTFNGTPATFTIVSDTEITTTVPTGATTGTVKVTTSSGTLNSNVAFRIVP